MIPYFSARFKSQSPECHLNFKSGHFLMDLNLKSGHLVFDGFMAIFEKSAVGFVGMWENRRFFQVIVGSVVKS
jgi:hypothetical protein